MPVPLWLEDDVFYLKYLPEEPISLGDPAWATAKNRVVDTINVSDMDSEQGVEVAYTPTENIVTKMKVTWRLSLAPDSPYPSDSELHEQTMVLRHNLDAYGLHEKSFNWFIYNQPDIILKCATFWLIRMSTTYKTLKFRTFLNKLNCESLDTILFNDGGRQYAATGPIKAVVKKAAYNSAENCIDFECELPVKAGEMAYYPFYWPSKLPKSVTWPPADEIASGAAGGGGIGIWASGNLPTGTINGQISGQTVFVGGPNVVYGPHSDRGDSTPTDEGFVAQSTFPSDSISVVPTGVRPGMNTGIAFLTEEEPIDFELPIDETVIDLHKTKIIDSINIKSNKNQVGHFGDFFSINKEGGLRLELAVAQAVYNGGEGGYTTSGRDGRLADVLTVRPLPEGIDGTHQDKMVMIDATGDGVFAVTDDVDNGAQLDLQYDENGDVVGAGTAFYQEE